MGAAAAATLLRENQLRHPSKLPEDPYYQELLKRALKSPGLLPGFCFCLNAHVAITEDLFQCFLLSHAIVITFFLQAFVQYC